ncbi:hypothetical protein BS50DRAFT_41075 [Corynespora cassiicola Philippines]|uniref:Uncharacterized protein n=1 Tax=Corynespora cassiicola Philippines TaxID=1448308 RepID=A0A2T2PCU2_CORCC|nr:hypothetical protein BS50DRAFT_41075 [Corynespora cassiicola Philippines]
MGLVQGLAWRVSRSGGGGRSGSGFAEGDCSVGGGWREGGREREGEDRDGIGVMGDGRVAGDGFERVREGGRGAAFVVRHGLPRWGEGTVVSRLRVGYIWHLLRGRWRW